jgi:hypothetical protein
MGRKITKIRKTKLQKTGNKNYKNLGTKFKKRRFFFSKMQEQMLKKSGNKNPGIFFKKIREQKLQKSGNKKLQKSGEKITKI